MKPEGKGKRRSSHCSLVKATGVLWAGKGGMDGGERHLANNSVLPWGTSARAGSAWSRLLPHLGDWHCFITASTHTDQPPLPLETVTDLDHPKWGGDA